MREEKMREWMQQDLAVPKKVHDGFEKGLQQVYQLDLEPGDAERFEEMRDGGQQTGQKKHRGFWRRAGLVAAAAAAVAILIFHEPIYNYAKSLFMHETITVADQEVQSEDMEMLKINDEALVNEYPGENYFASLEEVGEKLGVSFLKSSMENPVTGKGRVLATIYRGQGDGEVSIYDDVFVCHDISNLEYDPEGGGIHSHLDSGEAYTIACHINFHTQKFQDSYEWGYDDFYVVEEYETAGGLHATILASENDGQDVGGVTQFDLRAVIIYDNMMYEYSVGDAGCRLPRFKTFLDTLQKPDSH